MLDNLYVRHLDDIVITHFSFYKQLNLFCQATGLKLLRRLLTN